MVTLKLSLVKSTRAKDGTYKIRLAIGHKSQVHYIVTPYKVSSVSQFVNGTIVGTPTAHADNIKLRRLLDDYESRLEKVVNPNDYSCKELRDLLQQMPSLTTRTTFMTAVTSLCNQLRKEHRNTTASMTEFQAQRFIDFKHGDFFLADMTPTHIEQYSSHLRIKGDSIAYQNVAMNKIRSIINYAIRNGVVRYEIHPFAYYRGLKADPKENDISIDDIRLIRDSVPTSKGMIKARDIFMLSFYLGGINLIDLISYDFRNTDEIEYIRNKTRNTKQSNRKISFSIPPEALPIINRWMNPATGHLDFLSSGSYASFKINTTRTIKRLAISLGIKKAEKVCYYTARKSFVQIGFDLGIPLEVLEYCIGQSMKSDRPIYNYLKIMRRHADAAIRQILDDLATTHK